MKNLTKALFTIGISVSLFACKKSVDPVTLDGGAINITNAVVGGATITFSTNSSIISSNNTIGSNSAALLPIASGQTAVTVGVPAVAATATAAAIPAVVYYNQTLTVDKSANYSLFLTGTSVSVIDNVLIKENFQRTYADSVCGIRFINLAPGSNPISVNIKGGANASEVTSLAYKAYSNFKQYPAKSVNKTILFEIRDATTGALLYPTNGSGYTVNVPYFHNVTLVYRGNGTNVGIILDNNY
ncbi:MAG: hypothetical protein JWQ66_359 [Mucilaginibacter sp.]|nr:hypothetical protein [Mucilaginibacter sp.]